MFVDDIVSFPTLATYAIEIPRKVSRTKVKNVFHPTIPCDNVEEGFFLYESLRKTAYRATTWQPGTRTDILPYKDSLYTEELKSLDIGSVSTQASSLLITKLVRKFWDIFTKIGLKRSMLGFEFRIDTGTHTHTRMLQKTLLRTS